VSPRALLAAGAALLALTLALAMVVAGNGAVLSLGGGAADAPAPAPVPAPTPVAAVGVVVPAVAPAPAPEPPRVTPASIRAHPSARADVGWDEVPVAIRFSELGSGLAAPVKRGLDEARAQMDACFEAEARALARLPAAPEPDVGGPAVLVLLLESRPGGLDVVSTELESLGTSTKALVSCCREVLKGWSLDVAGAPPARRYRLKLVLQ
jgi:hypothetical protein